MKRDCSALLLILGNAPALAWLPGEDTGCASSLTREWITRPLSYNGNLIAKPVPHGHNGPHDTALRLEGESHMLQDETDPKTHTEAQLLGNPRTSPRNKSIWVVNNPPSPLDHIRGKYSFK